MSRLPARRPAGDGLRRVLRGILLLGLLWLCLLGRPGPAAAQAVPAALPSGTEAAETPAADAPPTDTEIQALLGALEDDAARARLIAQLRLLLEARDAAAGTAAATADGTADATESDRPDSLGAQLLAMLSDRVGDLGGQLAALGTAFRGLPRLADWGEQQLGDPAARARWIEAVLTAATALAAGLLARWLARLAMQRPVRALEARSGAGLGAKAVSLLVRALLDVVALVAFVLGAYAALSTFDAGAQVRLVTLTLVNATLVVGAVGIATRALLAPNAPGLRLFRMSDATARHAARWVRRLAVVAAFGYFIVEAALLLGLPREGRRGLLALVIVLLAILLIVLILQSRRQVGSLIRGLAGPDTARARLAEIWHVPAVAYVVVTAGIALLSGQDGFAFMLRATLLSTAILLAARVFILIAERAFALVPVRLPGLVPRSTRLRELIRQMIEIGIVLLAGVALLGVWGVGVLGWFETELARTAVGSLLSIALILAIAVTVWQVASAMISRALAGTDAEGRPLVQSARVKTLLGLIRNALMVTLVVVVTLIVLSELGIDIAPLLAGAGVIGLAVGFGSQALVKDVITGLFNLFENTVSIGDVVSVGGRSGAVEGMSIRTIRLRDYDGSVYTIPWGEVTTVANMTRGFSYAVFDITVGYREDLDRVMDAVRAVGAELQADPVLGRDILAAAEVAGVDKLGDSTVAIKARLKTRPMRQWDVGREFNRRLKRRFDEMGVQKPPPTTTLLVTPDARGLPAPAAGGPAPA